MFMFSWYSVSNDLFQPCNVVYLYLLLFSNHYFLLCPALIRWTLLRIPCALLIVKNPLFGASNSPIVLNVSHSCNIRLLAWLLHSAIHSLQPYIYHPLKCDPVGKSLCVYLIVETSFDPILNSSVFFLWFSCYPKYGTLHHIQSSSIL